MSGHLVEALFIGAKEGIKLTISAFIVITLLRRTRRDYLVKPIWLGAAVVLASSFVVIFIDVSREQRDVAASLVGYVFGLFYLFSLAALIHVSGTNMLGPLKPVFERKAVLAPLLFFLTIIYFFPDMVGSSLYIKDLYLMAESSIFVYLLSGVAFIISAVILFIGLGRVRLDITRLFGVPQVLLILSLIKLIGGGVRGFAEFSLIPSTQAGLMKLTHDVVHQCLVLLMVPDHPILSVTTWNFIGSIFSETTGLWLSLFIFILPLGIFLRQHFSSEPVLPADIKTGAFRRKMIKSFRDDRVIKSIPVFVFLIVIMATWFSQKGDPAAKLYNPDPKPIVAEGDRVVIPLQFSGVDLRDGMLHKFSIMVNNENIRILVMKKPDGTLAVCLDACEICLPDGYAQGKDYLLCIYCITPIPYDTVGHPGGCNPIPLTYLVTEKDVQIDVQELLEKWALVKAGSSKGELKK